MDDNIYGNPIDYSSSRNFDEGQHKFNEATNMIVLKSHFDQWLSIIIIMQMVEYYQN